MGKSQTPIRVNWIFVGLDFQSNDYDARHFGRLPRFGGNQILPTGRSDES